MVTLAKTTRTMYKRGMKKKRIVIRTFDDVLEVFGSRQKLADWAHISVQGVSNWCEEVPPGYHYKLHLWAQSRGHRLDPSYCKLMSDGTAIMNRPRERQRRAA